MLIVGLGMAMLAILPLTSMSQSSGRDGLSEVVSDLQGVYRHGQVFLTWQEAEIPEGVVLRHTAPRDIGRGLPDHACAWAAGQTDDRLVREKLQRRHE